MIQNALVRLLTEPGALDDATLRPPKDRSQEPLTYPHSWAGSDWPYLARLYFLAGDRVISLAYARMGLSCSR
jgi:hypothetical protein